MWGSFNSPCIPPKLPLRGVEGSVGASLMSGLACPFPRLKSYCYGQLDWGHVFLYAVIQMQPVIRKVPSDEHRLYHRTCERQLAAERAMEATAPSA